MPSKDLDTVNRNNLPDFLLRSPHYEYTPRLFFEFACLDSAKESIHEIYLMIREWNTFEEFEAFYESAGADEGDPDVEGIEGKDCKYEYRGGGSGGGLCNDWKDLDDFKTYPRIYVDKNVFSNKG